MKNLPVKIRCGHNEHSDIDAQIKCLISHKPISAIEEDGCIIINNHSYKIIEKVHEGSYGSLYLVESPTKELFYWKSREKADDKLRKEALLQSLAHGALRAHGLTWAVPEVEAIFQHPTSGCGFFMSYLENTEIFANYLKKSINWSQQSEENDKVLIEVISQLAIYLCILEDTLKMNHRDLKSSNVVLIQKSHKPFQLGYFRKGRKIVLNTSLRTILIDFGFACILHDEKIIAADDYLPSMDGCPKEGRDLFVFLAHLWKIEAIRRCMTPKMANWFKQTLKSETKTWWDHITKIPDRGLKTIYLYAASNLFSMPSCTPFSILETLSSEFPSILSSTTC